LPWYRWESYKRR